MTDPNYLRSLFDLTGKTALVTGASSGLGRHFALTLARAGAQVALAARRADKLADAVKEIEALGGKAVAVSMDVLDRASVNAALDEAASRLGPIDILVNNAGVSGTQRPLDYDDAEWDWVVGTNLKGAWVVAQETARRMVAAKRPGNLINITSILGSRVTHLLTPYIAAKAGLKNLTQALALEFARYDIRVNSLAPGYFITEINEDELKGEQGEKLRLRIPTRRFGEYENLEGPLLLLASKAGAHMTGTEIVVDGGHLVNPL
ncbi:NAD(P)-dependent dehydrogenase (short-subunit alcohol dehydrogenase family) [Panacagrimonas perspica]|uniref:NAD(P)-dependent dehydrogenase (Short-subunit alcohol dehydrogenase family) n=1 Tax=Panacagrimonas perspica TaxID=381431 RepID=A0A4S3JZZ7_9GAMM|nr:SDR family NAD(P)-dependent oxidoreductase [Panacagrimonas perspica]TDU28359.1 NAD(P)-dependent dehydrogenase (short-subunit alcohol dehydrogenase family) [Panacagrimonas perspica]THD01222.1 2-deoxy-D-gluconate 3-dehydrogenase [Panacagrimonas perspica]